MAQVAKDEFEHDKVIAFEQDRVDCIHLAVEDRMRVLEHRLSTGDGGRRLDLEAMANNRSAELREWQASDPALCFGRFDLDDGETFYIGRRNIDVDCDVPITVVYWKAPITDAYYQSTAADPRGLSLKRTFQLAPDKRTILDLAEQRWGSADSSTSGPDPEPAGRTFADLLLAELE